MHPVKLWHYRPMQDDRAMSPARARIREAIQKVAVGPDRGRDLHRDDARAVMQEILSGEIDEVQTAVLLIALRMKREAMEEFIGLFEALQSSIDTVIAPVPDVFCLADPFDGYVRNVSMTPFIPPVLAACGLTSLLHGVETVGPKHGVTAQKVYQYAGISVDHTSQEIASMLPEFGWGYIDQASYAPSLNRLIGLRDRIVKRTALTTLERMLMPIQGSRATHLVLGYVHKAYPHIYANVAKHAGYESILLTKGVEGGLAPAVNKPLRHFFFDGQLPKNIDDYKEVLENQSLFTSESAALSVEQDNHDSVQRCLAVGLGVLAGESGVARDSLCLAAGQIIMAHNAKLSLTHGLNVSLAEAVEKVRRCLDNGAALERFEIMRAA